MRHSGVDFADRLALCAPDAETDCCSGAVSHFGREKGWVGVVDCAAVDADDEVELGIEGDIGVGVAQDLEAECVG